MNVFCLLAASRPWYVGEAATLARESGIVFYHVSTPLELEHLLAQNPDPMYIFFPHWSWLLPKQIWSHHECVMFHMTDLPFGRGGSPLQNLIARGVTETKISVFRCDGGVDDGPIYMKSNLSLYGGAEEIFLRYKGIVHGLILDILRERPLPQAQQGEPICFRRRVASESDISGLDTLGKIYDYIRMLDAEGYPPAFLNMNGLRLEFKRAALYDGHIQADVTISLQGGE